MTYLVHNLREGDRDGNWIRYWEKPPAKKQVFATKSAAWPKQQTVLTSSYQIPQTANGILSRFAISAIASSVRNSQLQDL